MLVSPSYSVRIDRSKIVTQQNTDPTPWVGAASQSGEHTRAFPFFDLCVMGDPSRS